jgi:voltage-gated potassium channel
MTDLQTPWPRWRRRLHEVIFEADTQAGKVFDVALLVMILLSVLAVILESVAEIEAVWGPWLRGLEWFFTGLFTLEYLLRLACVTRPWGYATSFYGVVDLLAVIPTYLSLLVGGAQSLVVIRALRLLRVFRVFKITRYVGEVAVLIHALRATRAKITVFLLALFTLALIMGSLMYVVEGAEHGFTSIPRGLYWAVVTITTVGYGDIAPRTVLGQGIATLAMVLGYSLIVIPTGIFATELVKSARKPLTTQACPSCSREGHDEDARFCKYCGASLEG